MPMHGNFTNGFITIRVNETANKISYESEDPTYHGSLTFELTEATLDIHVLDAQPEGHKLGALLVWVCANTAIWNRKTQIRATATARTAIPFYATMGFGPDPTEFKTAMTATLGIAEARSPHEYVATWVAQTGACLSSAWTSCSAQWRQA